MAVQVKSRGGYVAPSRTERLGALLGWLFAVSVHAAPLLIILGISAYGLLALWRHGGGAQQYRIRPSVELAQAQGFRPEAVREFNRLGALAVGRSLLDPLLLADLRAEYLRSPWVRSVSRMKRAFPNELYIEFMPRVPLVQVLHGGYYWLVDEDGIMLPVEGTRQSRAGLPVIRGDIDRRPADGCVWNDGGILGGISALLAIDDSPLRGQLAVVEIIVKRTEYLDRLSQPGRSRPRLEILASNGMNILWGTAGDDFPGELRDAEKIALLRQLVADLPNPAPGQNFDVRTRVGGISMAGAGSIATGGR